jgi:uncharacterized membrane protein
VFPGAWMAWNLALAALPLLLARTLFEPERRPSPRWWLGVVVFVALLPNAPYVLTDIIHFDDAVRASESNLWVFFAVVPAYTALLGCGVACYVASVVRLERWLRAQGWTLPQLLGADITVHALCAVGVFLGRAFRFNSWDLLARPGEIAAAVQVPEPRSVAILVGLFAVLGLGTAGLRIGLGIRVRTPSNS